MANNSERPWFALLGILVLASGGAFFWSNRPNSTSSGSVAVAAPKPPAPKGALKPKNATAAERTAAQKTISAQLKAFNTGNWNEAVKFQSEGLRTNFASPEAFGQMIERTYPAFVRPKKVAYGRAINIAGHIQFEVNLTGQDDSVTRAVYSLVKEKGNYRVESVFGGAAQPADEGAATV